MRAHRTRRIEAVALGVLAMLPLAPWLAFLLRDGVPRYVRGAAAVEIASRHVARGETLLGTPTPFGFHHPGPLFAYLAAAFTRGPSSTGPYVAACLLNAAAAAGSVASARLFARRSHSAALLAILLAWFAAFGNACVRPASAFVVVLPLAAFLVCAALFARGKSAAAFPSAVFGSFALQIHLAAAPTVMVGTAVALGSFFAVARRRGGSTREERGHVATSVALGLLLFVPSLVEQIRSPEGNLTKLVRFFVRRAAPLRTLGEAVDDWTFATALLPERIGRRAVALESLPLSLPLGDPTSTTRLLAALHVVALALAFALALRRRDTPSLALLVAAALANGVALASLEASVGPSDAPLVFWSTAATTVGWAGVFGALGAAFGGQLLRMPKLANVLALPLVLAAFAAAILTTHLQRGAIARAGFDPSPELRSVVEQLRLRPESLVVHREEDPDLADAIQLELEKDGARLGVTANTLHVRMSPQTCPDVVARSGPLVLFGCP